MGKFLLEAHLKLFGPWENPEDLTHLSENLLGTRNIYDMLWKLQISFWRDLTMPRRFSFASVTSVSDTCMMSELYFQDFCFVFSWVLSLGRPFTFWGLYKAPIVTLELTIWSYPLLRALLSLWVFSWLESGLCLWIQVQPLVDSRVEEASSVDSDTNSSWRPRLVDSSPCSLVFLR